MLTLLESTDDPFLRTTRPGHFTGSALVVDAAGQHMLILFHTKLQKWLQPGGHADGQQDLAQVAWREATEETGIAGLVVDPAPIDLDIHEVFPPSEDSHLHFDVRYLARAPAEAVAHRNHESEALRWVRLGELDSVDADPGLHRLARRGGLSK